MFFHPIYTIANVIACGNLGKDELAGFALGSLTIGIMAISIGFSFSATVATPIAISYGAGNLRMCRVYLYRQYYLNTLIFPVICIPLVFIRQIYDFIG